MLLLGLLAAAAAAAAAAGMAATGQSVETTRFLRKSIFLWKTMKKVESTDSSEKSVKIEVNPTKVRDLAHVMHVLRALVRSHPAECCFTRPRAMKKSSDPQRQSPGIYQGIHQGSTEDHTFWIPALWDAQERTIE